jgi:uncharacterized membrane protein
MDAFTYVLSVNGLIFSISIIFYYFPPKKINSIYGYRTHRTIQNNDVWSFANKLFAVILLKYSGISFIAALVLTFINEALMNSWFSMAFMIFTLLVAIIGTEKELNKNFDDEGNRKVKKQ